MKKIFFVLIICFAFLPLCLFANEEDTLSYNAYDNTPSYNNESAAIEDSG